MNCEDADLLLLLLPQGDQNGFFWFFFYSFALPGMQASVLVVNLLVLFLGLLVTGELQLLSLSLLKVALYDFFDGPLAPLNGQFMEKVNHYNRTKQKKIPMGPSIKFV